MPRTKKQTQPPQTWFISLCAERGDPRWAYWHYWDGKGWTNKFSEAVTFTDPEECGRAAQEVHAATGDGCMTWVFGRGVGGVLVVGRNDWHYWTGSGWTQDWTEARQFSGEPASWVCDNTVRHDDPWQPCHDECERVLAETGIKCAVTFIQPDRKIKRQRRRFPIPLPQD